MRWLVLVENACHCCERHLGTPRLQQGQAWHTVNNATDHGRDVADVMGSLTLTAYTHTTPVASSMVSTYVQHLCTVLNRTDSTLDLTTVRRASASV